MTVSAPTMAKAAPDPSLSLYQLLDPAVLADPYPLYRRLREHDPVHWDAFLHAWVVTDYDNVLTVLHKFSADRTPAPDQIKSMGLETLEPIAQMMTKQMLFMDAPAHTRLRKLCSAAFTSRSVEHLRSQIHDIANGLIDKVLAARPDGHRSPTSPRRCRRSSPRNCSACRPPITSSSRPGPPISPKCSAIFSTIQTARTACCAASQGMTAYFRSAIREQERSPREGLIRSLMTAEVDGGRLTEEEVIANTIVTMVGGQETTTNLIGNGLLTLLRNPAQLAQLRDDPSVIETGGRRAAAL